MNCTINGKIVSGKIKIFNSVIVVGIQGKGTLTPRRYAISNKRVLRPICIFVFMLLMSPGIVGGTETIIAAAARQFSERHKGQDAYPRLERKTYDSICIPVPSTRPIHCGNVDICAMYKPILGHKLQSVSKFLDYDEQLKTYVCYHDSGDRAEEDGVTTHKGQKARCTIQPGMRLLPKKTSSKFSCDARTSRVFPMGRAPIRQ